MESEVVSVLSGPHVARACATASVWSPDEHTAPTASHPAKSARLPSLTLKYRMTLNYQTKYEMLGSKL